MKTCKECKKPVTKPQCDCGEIYMLSWEDVSDYYKHIGEPEPAFFRDRMIPTSAYFDAMPPTDDDIIF